MQSRQGAAAPHWIPDERNRGGGGAAGEPYYILGLCLYVSFRCAIHVIRACNNRLGAAFSMDNKSVYMWISACMRDACREYGSAEEEVGQ